MRRIHVAFIAMIVLVVQMPLVSQIVKKVDVGKIRARVLENGHQSESQSGTHGDQGVVSYEFDGAKLTNRQFSRFTLRCAGTHIGVRNWTDQKGVFHPAWTAGANYGISDAVQIMPVVPDPNGVTIHKYMRYRPPTIVVDGKYLNTPFPYDESDEVAPEKIPGTADVMVESRMRTWIGLDLHQRVYGWSQKNHADYVLYEYIFTNTGNVDTTAAIELPKQILDSLYIMRTNEAVPAEVADYTEKERVSWYGCRPGEDIRMMYTYPTRQTNSVSDNLGMPYNDYNQPRLTATQYLGEATLFVSNAANDFTHDNPASPQMHTIWDARLAYIKENVLVSNHVTEQGLALNVMKRGIVTADSYDASYVKPPYMTDAYPGTFHEIPPDSLNRYISDIKPWGGLNRFHEVPMASNGPFRLAPGDSIRFVYAIVEGTISKRKAFEIGRKWYDGKNPANPPCDPPPGCTWNAGKPTDNLPSPYKLYPDLYRDATLGAAGDYNNWAKDCWVATGKDSLFQNARAAQWAVRQNLQVPIAPPPPSIEVQSRANSIRIKWGSESESAADFAGYRVYRAIGSFSDSEWVPIYETKGSSVHQYDDTAAIRGTAYYYYVSAFDDGLSNVPDFNGKKERLESGKYLNMTTAPASLARPSVSSLDNIRVVPNPFSLSARSLQFPSQPNKIAFYNLPPECTIRIFSESGDLVKTIEHTRGTGDDFWGEATIANDHQTTDSGQRPVSGLYIANIKTPDGRTKNVKFLIVR
jgi:hypothetical protein